MHVAVFILNRCGFLDGARLILARSWSGAKAGKLIKVDSEAAILQLGHKKREGPAIAPNGRRWANKGNVIMNRLDLDLLERRFRSLQCRVLVCGVNNACERVTLPTTARRIAEVSETRRIL